MRSGRSGTRAGSSPAEHVSNCDLECRIRHDLREIDHAERGNSVRFEHNAQPWRTGLVLGNLEPPDRVWPREDRREFSV